MCSPFKTEDSSEGENASPLKTVNGGKAVSCLFDDFKICANRARRSVFEM
jgi:hypothetical protein